MNYAALLAVMVLLAFCFPMAVRLGESVGLSAGAAAVTLWSLLVFVLAVAFVRWRVSLEHQRAAVLERGRAQVAADPGNAAAYLVDGQHLAQLLLQRGRRREAAEMVDRYAQLAGAKEAEILMLREALSSADRWRFKRKAPTRPGVREMQAAAQVGEEEAKKQAAQDIEQAQAALLPQETYAVSAGAEQRRGESPAGGKA